MRFSVLAVCCLLSLRLGAQDAKQLFDQSLVEGSSCKKMQLACQAAKLDPKKKDYQDACDRFRTSTNRSDETFRVKAIDSLSKNDFAGALRWTNSFVCNADTKSSLQSQIADAQKASSPAAPAPAAVAAVQKADQSSAFLGEARSSFSEGKFDAAVASAKQVTDANLKPYAEEIVTKVGAYRSAVNAAHSSEASKDYQGALNNWRTAQAINGNGPDSPAVNIARLEPFTRKAAPAPQPAPVQVASKPVPPPPSAKQAPPPPVDINAQVQNYWTTQIGRQQLANCRLRYAATKVCSGSSRQTRSLYLGRPTSRRRSTATRQSRQSLSHRPYTTFTVPSLLTRKMGFVLTSTLLLPSRKAPRTSTSVRLACTKKF